MDPSRVGGAGTCDPLGLKLAAGRWQQPRHGPASRGRLALGRAGPPCSGARHWLPGRWSVLQSLLLLLCAWTAGRAAAPLGVSLSAPPQAAPIDGPRQCCNPESPLQRRGLLLSTGALGLGAAGEPASALSTDEKRVASLFEATTPSVVSISKNAPQAVLGEERASGSIYGSGFVWDKEHVVTNFHVITGMDRPFVTFLSQEKGSKSVRRTTFDASIVGSDAASDIAVLQVGSPVRDEEASLPAPKALPRGTSSDLVVGQDVYAFGNPFGLEHSLSRGIVSGVSRTMESAGGRPINGVIQTDASINPGNSGGPLLNSDGKVVGVNTAILSGSGTFAGVGLAIPIDTVSKNVESIISKGFVRRPFLGIVFAPDVMAEELQLDGIMVMRVVPGGPAEAAGVRPVRGGRLGDIVVSIDDKPIRFSDDMFKLLDQRQPGDEIKLTVQRASADADSDKYENVDVKLTLGSAGAGVKQ
mmetsp:Transcript_66303/g.153992  ORF Transcript_66303/g.153992 Transcript_66303/m.153992 type:complete len:472 (+) Transcript_66303:2-1417(+)